MRLIDILVRPMQRLTKYALLLKAILKKTEDGEQQETLKIMAQKVESFVSHVNSHLRQRQENERLKTIIARIDSYEPVVGLLCSPLKSHYVRSLDGLHFIIHSWPFLASLCITIEPTSFLDCLSKIVKKLCPFVLCL